MYMGTHFHEVLNKLCTQAIRWLLRECNLLAAAFTKDKKKARHEALP